jgi:hypothetical protein
MGKFVYSNMLSFRGKKGISKMHQHHFILVGCARRYEVPNTIAIASIWSYLVCARQIISEDEQTDIGAWNSLDTP